jgi:hypothetical protein
MMYLFRKSYNRLELPDFDEPWYEIDHQGTALGPLVRHRVWILQIIEAMAECMLKKLDPALAAFVGLRDVIHATQFIHCMLTRYFPRNSGNGLST